MFNKFKFSLLLVSLLSIVGCGGTSSTSSPSTSVWTDVALGRYFTDQLTLKDSYEGKNFLSENIGQATLSNCVDGDTAHFKVGSESIKIRFLGIDTPESTIAIEPWGKAASVQTCKWLTEAKVIVLEGNKIGERAELDTTGTRYLAYVWAGDSASTLKNINLNVIEEAYSRVKIGGGKYDDIFFKADGRTATTKKRIWGEKDSNYDYSNKYVEVTPSELTADKDKYLDKKVKVTGYVSRKITQHFFLTDNEGDGVYVFAGFYPTAYIKVGNYVQVQGIWTKNDNYGYQLADVDRSYLEDKAVLNDETIEIDASTEFTIPEIVSGMGTGMLIRLNDLTVTSIPTNFDETKISGWAGYSVYAKDSNGNQITLRVDASFNQNEHANNILPSYFGSVGGKIDIVGVPSYFMDSYQLMICLKTDIFVK